MQCMVPFCLGDLRNDCYRSFVAQPFLDAGKPVCGAPHLKEEICMSGSMSGERKRSVAAWPKQPRLSSTLHIAADPAEGPTSRPVPVIHLSSQFHRTAQNEGHHRLAPPRRRWLSDSRAPAPPASGVGMMALDAAPLTFGGESPLLPDFWKYPPRLPHGIGARLLLGLAALHLGSGRLTTIPPRDQLSHASWSSSALASCKTGASKPSVNQP